MTDEELQWNKIVGGKKASKCWRYNHYFWSKLQTPEIYDNDGEKSTLIFTINCSVVIQTALKWCCCIIKSFEITAQFSMIA